MKTVQELLIEKELANTPMKGTANSFIEAGKKYDVDPLFVASIGWKESQYAKAYSQESNDSRHSFAGVMAWDAQGNRYLKQYATWNDAIFDLTRLIKQEYLAKGLDSVNKIWAKYAPISDNNLSWGPGVTLKYKSLLTKSNNLDKI